MVMFNGKDYSVDHILKVKACRNDPDLLPGDEVETCILCRDHALCQYLAHLGKPIDLGGSK